MSVLSLCIARNSHTSTKKCYMPDISKCHWSPYKNDIWLDIASFTSSSSSSSSPTLSSWVSWGKKESFFELLTCIDTKYSNTREGSDDADEKTQAIRDGCNSHGYSRVSKRICHSFFDRCVNAGSSPSSQHDKGIVYSNAKHQERSCHVDADEGYSAVHDQTHGSWKDGLLRLIREVWWDLNCKCTTYQL